MPSGGARRPLREREHLSPSPHREHDSEPGDGHQTHDRHGQPKPSRPGSGLETLEHRLPPFLLRACGRAGVRASFWILAGHPTREKWTAIAKSRATPRGGAVSRYLVRDGCSLGPWRLAPSCGRRHSQRANRRERTRQAPCSGGRRTPEAEGWTSSLILGLRRPALRPDGS
jgi:hypothetical protein